MQYPLEMRFTLFSLSQQITVRDAAGSSILFVKQKMFRLKEKIEVFSDSSQSKKLFEINSRILDLTRERDAIIEDAARIRPILLVEIERLRSAWDVDVFGSREN